ncbi:MAG: hypothetical protein WA194_00085 [Patescibacteria group bacterium]
MSALTKSELDSAIAQLELRLTESIASSIEKSVAKVEENVKNSLVKWMFGIAFTSICVTFTGVVYLD